jgi:glucosamine kinase
MTEQKIRLIVDSGSTKSDWVLLGMPTKEFYQTKGFNPVFHDSEYISREIRSNEALSAISVSVEEVFFYGAGCSSKERNAIVEKGLSSVFENAKISVDHDLTACAFATFEGERTISCILGTGSNACLFDGERITQAVPSLGYILGDEGGGAYFGKELLAQFLYGRLPEDLQNSFQEKYAVSKEEVISKVYKEANPNSYLATYMEFAVKNASHPYIKEMIYQGFRKFNEIHVCSYADYRDVNVNYVGSIAYLFSEELKRACSDLGITLGKIIQKPIEGLVQYHQKYR